MDRSTKGKRKVHVSFRLILSSMVVCFLIGGCAPSGSRGGHMVPCLPLQEIETRCHSHCRESPDVKDVNECLKGCSDVLRSAEKVVPYVPQRELLLIGAAVAQKYVKPCFDASDAALKSSLDSQASTLTLDREKGMFLFYRELIKETVNLNLFPGTTSPLMQHTPKVISER